MSIFKCKMCGGTLEIQSNESVAVCEYCGTKQTIPRLDTDKRANLYDRANHFRRNNEFDKASVLYEQILSEDGKDAEAYWSLVLCRYGIEYVEDPATHKRVPTVNRAQFTSIYADADYRAALEYADGYQKSVYEEEAKAIDEIQKGILAISQKEEPFDVFICYKETDNNGRRTPDSVLANDLYHQLTQEGFKVFFSRITLEDKLGSAYEPYIFAALNSAKAMVVLGTKPEYFEAVWVKNEWSRFLALTKDGKKTLIPAYKDMDPYHLPPEFANLQAQDMSKLGFMQDLIRGIKKIVQLGEKKEILEFVDDPILERAFIFVENRDWARANEYFEKVLDQNPHNAEAYLGKLLVAMNVSKREDLASCANSFKNNMNYQMAKRYGDTKLLAELDGYIAAIEKRKSIEKMEMIYHSAFVAMNKAKTEDVFLAVSKKFSSISEYKNAAELATRCNREAEKIHKEKIYLLAVTTAKSRNPDKIREAMDLFASISGYKDAERQEKDCAYKLSAMPVKNVPEKKKKRKSLFFLLAPVVCLLIICIVSAFVVMSLVQNDGNSDSVIALPSDDVNNTFELSTPTISPVKTATPTAIPTKTPVKTATPTAIPTKTPVKTATPTAIPTKTPVKTVVPAATATPTVWNDINTNMQTGESVLFGTYEQDNNLSNGKEKIEWIVLGKRAGKALLISRYGLDCQPFNAIYTSVTWETCTLRNWLNTTFYTTAFDEKQQSVIASTTITNNENSYCGNDTIDKVFLLSSSEAKRFFASDTARITTVTAYAQEQGGGNWKGGTSWWLRTSYNDKSATMVKNTGIVPNGGTGVNYDLGAVRPAIWINLES